MVIFNSYVTNYQRVVVFHSVFPSPHVFPIHPAPCPNVTGSAGRRLASSQETGEDCDRYRPAAFWKAAEKLGRVISDTVSHGYSMIYIYICIQITFIYLYINIRMYILYIYLYVQDYKIGPCLD